MNNSESDHGLNRENLFQFFCFQEFYSEEIPIWVPFDNDIPKNAVKAGKRDGQLLYIGRAHHSGSLTPGLVPEVDKTCIIPWGTVSNTKEDFEILTSFSGDFSWVAAEHGRVPVNAFPAGHSEQGETLYIGRALKNGSLLVGKVQPSHRVCYVAYGGQELNVKDYEVLVV